MACLNYVFFMRSNIRKENTPTNKRHLASTFFCSRVIPHNCCQIAWKRQLNVDQASIDSKPTIDAGSRAVSFVE